MTTPAPLGDAAVEVVAIACSAGGTPALRHLLGALPSWFPAPIAVVQHFPDGVSLPLAPWWAPPP